MMPAAEAPAVKTSVMAATIKTAMVCTAGINMVMVMMRGARIARTPGIQASFVT